MRPVLSKIALFLSLSMLAGCSAPPKAPTPTTKVKLKDLAPIDAAQRGMVLPSSVSFKAVTFVVPAAEYNKVIRGALAGLNRGTGLARSPADFNANGFVAASGTIANAEKSIAIISQSNGRSLDTSYYTISDEKGYDIAMTTDTGEIALPYTYNGAKKLLPLKPGRLILRITVKRFAAWASVFKLTLQPAWRQPYEDSFVDRTLGASNDILFKAAAIEMNMQAGELVLVAPKEYKPDIPDMANIFMASSGNEPQVKITILMCTGMN
jgi:hypothetical protein